MAPPVTSTPSTPQGADGVASGIRHSPRFSPHQGRGAPSSVASCIRRSPRTPVRERVSPGVADSSIRRRSPQTPVGERQSPRVAASVRRSPRTFQQKGGSSLSVIDCSTSNPRNARASLSTAVERGGGRKKKTKPNESSAQTGGRSQRTPNYSEDEDYIIACAYVNVTADPIRGVGQKSDNFWNRVHDRFGILSEEHNVKNGIEIPMRNSLSLEQRWKKKISKCVQLWNKFYRQLKSVERSGWNEDKYMEEAAKLYASEVGEPFKHTKCVPILHQLPKFDPMVPTNARAPSSRSPPGDVSEDDNDEDDNGDSDYVVKNPSSSSKKRVNNANPVQGSAISRPIGMKKAKAIEKLKSGRTQAHAIDLTGGAAAFAEMSAATKELVAAVKVNTSLKREYLDAGRQSKWMRMAELYMGCGKKEKALALLSKIEEIEDEAGAVHTVTNTAELQQPIGDEIDSDGENDD